MLRCLGFAAVLVMGISLFPGSSGWCIPGNEPALITQDSEHFIFIYHPEDYLYIQPAIERAEGLWNQIIKDIGSAPIHRVLVVMAFTQDEFNQFQPEGHRLPDWVGGVAYPSQLRMVIRSPRLIRGHQEDTVRVFIHELTHLVLGNRFGNQDIPRWLNEGLAMYESYEWHPTQDILMGKYVLLSQLIPLSSLSQHFGKGGFDIRQAYLQSYSLVNYMIAAHGYEAFHQLLDHLREGGSFDHAVRAAFKVSPQEFEAQWRKSLRLRYNWIPLLTSSSVLWLLIMFVLMLTFLHRKRRNQKIMQKWAEEEDRLDHGDATYPSGQEPPPPVQ